MKSKILLLGLLLVVTIGCENHLDGQQLQIESNVDAHEMTMSSQNEIIRNVAQTVHDALVKSVDFTQIVKRMALEKFDGDYDILLSQIKDKEISDYVSLKGQNGNMSVADLFNELYPANGKSSFQDDILAAISQMYPNMQISVPVKIEKWEDGYIPTVVFVDSNFKDTVTEYVQGFDANGNLVWVDAINVPEEPVIVVGYNERMGLLEEQGEIDTKSLLSMNKVLSPMLSISNFVAELEGGFIRLSWVSTGQVLRSEVYCSTDENEFVKIGTGTNSSFIFNDVEANTRYDFYVKLIGAKGISSVKSHTETITTGNLTMLPLSSFQATPINDTQVMLTWEQNTASNNEYVQIYRKLLADDTVTGLGTLVASISNSNTRMFIDEGGDAGNKYLYTALNAKNGCVSNHKYDTIWKPYRNCSQADSVYVKRISYDASHCSDIESWIYGAPEFRISVHTIPGESTTPSTRVNNKFLYFTDRDYSSQMFNSGNYLFSWLPSTTYDCMTIHMTEWDRENADDSISISVSVGMKTTIGDNIEFPLNATINLTINSDDVPIGFGHTYYFETPHPLISLENFGFQVRLSNTNVNN